MAKLKFSVHPLFIVFGLYFAFTGRVFSFIVFTLVALIHELGHSLAASDLGYKLNRVVLMPYGAIVSGEQRLFSYKDEIKIALAGPIINLLTGFLFAAVWWFIPESYPYTDLAVFASLSIATINLLPCYPLDGGRVLLAFLSERLMRKTALTVVRTLGIILSAALLGLFIYSIFVGINISLLFFSSFMLFGNLFVKKDSDYVRIFSGMDMRAVQKGRRVIRVAVAESSKVKVLYKFISVDHLTEVLIIGDDGKTKNTLSAGKVFTLVSNGRPYSSVGEEARRLDIII